MGRRYVIVGNGIAGQTCAEELRRNDGECSIVMMTRERHPLYNRVALPRYLKGQLREEKVMLRTPDDYVRQNIDIRFETSALKVDPASRTVTTDRGDSFPFDAALIATGGTPRRLEAQGIEDIGNIHALYTLDDARRIVEAAERAERVLVVGGGFIAYELAEAIAHRGRAVVTWLMRGPWFLRSVLDEAAGRLCHGLGAAAGVDFVCSDDIDRFERTADGQVCVTASGGRIGFDMLVYGIGLDFATGPAEAGGIAVAGGVVTDSRLRTDKPGVFAAGDVAVFHDVVLGRANQMGTWDSAHAQGRVAALNMAGGEKDFADVATYTTTMFGSTLAVMGMTPAVEPELEAVSALALAERQYRKLFFRKDRLVGAIMIGSPKGRKKLIELMRSDTPVEGAREALLEMPARHAE